ncbi:MAG: hypothetical protein DRR19_27020 [Candidatus Parabeggiatoa sp. nov. 1]|nr:MAG: hypothetical protein DRR19_27020 [Gammaproteobacteria bacterium]
MSIRTQLLVMICAITFSLGFGASNALANKMPYYTLKKSVVKITSRGHVGTGFVVKKTPNTVYIVTAAQVIQGNDKYPAVELFGNQRFTGVLQYTEKKDNPRKGLALIAVRSKAILTRVSVLPLSEKCFDDFNHYFKSKKEVAFSYSFSGESSRWGYIGLTSPNRKGRDLTFRGVINQMNFGSPIIKGNDVIGIITTNGPSVYAASSLAIREFLVGIGNFSSQMSSGETIGPPTIEPTEQQFPQSGTSGIKSKSPPLFRDPLQMGGEGPEMAIIPAGTFSMGDIQGSGQRDEQPVHSVSIKRFAMSVYEVTFAEYDFFAEMTGRKKPADKGWGRGNRPVINVSWEDATAYTNWLTQQTEQQYHLPTEAEWEYAARAGAQTEYSWGNDIGRNRANCAVCGSKWGNKQTAPVGSFAANPFGLHDMVANVYEWTCSASDKKYKKKELRCSCKKSTYSYCVYRGGSWRSLPKYARVANRSMGKKNRRNNNLGFRIAREIRE